MLQPHTISNDSIALDKGGYGRAMAPPILLQYLQVIQRWKWAIAGIVVSSLILGLVATLLATPKYVANARIEISREQKNITKVEGLESADARRDLEFYQTQYALLKARSLAERVSRDLRLSTNDAFYQAHGTKPAGSLALFGSSDLPASAGDRDRRDKQVVELLLKNIGIVPIRGSALVDISYVSASPQLSTQIANAWAQQFIQSSMDRRFESTADARKFLEGRLAELRARLEQSERELVNYASRKGIVTLNQIRDAEGKTQNERTLVAADLEALNAALAQAIADRVAAESRARAGGMKGANAAALSNAAIAELRQKRAVVAAEYAKILVQFEPGYPAARALSEQIRVLDASIDREEARVSNSQSSEYREAAEREVQLRKKVEEFKARLGLQQRDSIQYNIYLREADTNRQLYDALLQRYKEIGVAGIGANNIVVVDPAKIPDKPSSPKLSINLALALLLGLGLAVVATFALEQVDEGLRDPSQVNRLLQVPLLGSVPDIDQENVLEVLRDSKSVLSEAYLSIRSNLAFSTDHGMPRTLMVTSTRPAEGKSTTSLALAMVLGRTGKNVLLVDADMRSPSMNEFLGLPNHSGLSNFLTGDNDWKQLIQPSAVKGLSVLAAGPMPPSAAELLSSDRMLLLVEQLLKSFDHVVIDSPPVLGLADAPLLSRAVEGCIFVVEAEGVAIRGIMASLGRLQAVHAHVLGVVLSKLKNRHANFGYGYGYGYGYGGRVAENDSDQGK